MDTNEKLRATRRTQANLEADLEEMKAWRDAAEGRIVRGMEIEARAARKYLEMAERRADKCDILTEHEADD